MAKKKVASKAPLTFHPFSRLPPEIRVQIWDSTIEPRHVTFGKASRTRWPKENTPTPVILKVCRESRDVGLKSYSTSCCSVCAFKGPYFNPDIDTLYLGGTNIREIDDRVGDFSRCLEESGAGIKSLAIEVSSFLDRPWEVLLDEHNLLRFPHLEQFMMIANLDLVRSVLLQRAGKEVEDATAVDIEDLRGLKEEYGVLTLLHARPIRLALSSFINNHPELDNMQWKAMVKHSALNIRYRAGKMIIGKKDPLAPSFGWHLD